MRYLSISIIFIALISCLMLIDACGGAMDSSLTTNKQSKELLGEISALPLTYKSPVDNPTTKEKLELGRILFYDPILSGSKDVSCASCHHPEFGYAEGLELAIGVGGKGLGRNRVFVKNDSIPFTQRNSQAILNTAFNGIDNNGDYVPEKAPMFWDLRAESLEEQAMQPSNSLKR